MMCVIPSVEERPELLQGVHKNVYFSSSFSYVEHFFVDSHLVTVHVCENDSKTAKHHSRVGHQPRLTIMEHSC